MQTLHRAERLPRSSVYALSFLLWLRILAQTTGAMRNHNKIRPRRMMQRRCQAGHHPLPAKAMAERHQADLTTKNGWLVKHDSLASQRQHAWRWQASRLDRALDRHRQSEPARSR